MEFLIHFKKHQSKPTSAEVAFIQRTWDKAILSNDLELLRKSIALGQTIKFNLNKLDTLIIDADNVNINLTDVLNKLKQLNLVPTIAYNSFSSNEIKNNFRLIYFFEKDLTKNSYINFTLKLEELLNISLDFAFANNSKQLCYGTNKEVYLFAQSEIELDNSPVNNSLNRFCFTNKSLANKTNVNVLELENMQYLDFCKTLTKILEDKQHIGYDLALRWFFANPLKPDLQKSILGLASCDNQRKIISLYKSRGWRYGLRLFEPNGNFQKIFKNQLKKARKNEIEINSNLENF